MNRRRSRCSRRLLCAVTFPAVVFASSTASASPLLDTAGAVGGNAGAQGVVSGPSAASTYFNPALLAEAEEELLLGYAMISEQMGVTLAGRRGGDVPMSVGQRDVVGADGLPIANDTVPSDWLRQGCPAGTAVGQCASPGFPARPRQARGSSGETRSYIAFGLVKQLFVDRLRFGVYGMFPLSSFTTVRGFYNDEREALFSNSLHPELYGDRLTALSVAFGAGLKILPTLSVGASFGLSLSNTVESRTYVRDTTAYDKLLLDNSVSTHVNVAPNIGVRFQPLSRLRLGAVVRTPSAFELETSIKATLPSGTESGTTRRETYDFVPWRIGIGGEVDVFERDARKISVAGSVNYALWSTYEDRHGQSPETYGGDLGWSNTLSGSLGGRYVQGPFRGFVDGLYVPSPVPDQVGRSSYVDNARVGAMLGFDVELRIAGVRLRPGLSLYAHRFVPRRVTKDNARIRDEVPDDSVVGATRAPLPGAAGLQTNNPGWPGFGSTGWLWGGTFAVSVPL